MSQSDSDIDIKSDDECEEVNMMSMMFTSDGVSLADTLASIAQSIDTQNRILVKILTTMNNK
jgi:pilus assembly protein TadC